MTAKDKIARRKLSLLELAADLSNVSRACKVMGYSRQQFYEIRRNFQTYGAEGLIDRLPGAKGPHPNRVSAEIEQAVLDHALVHPCHGAVRVEQELRLKGIQVSAGGIRGVWQRHGLLTKHERLLRLEKATAERKIELTDEQTRMLERFSPEFRERHIEAPHTGSLVAVDTFFVGTLKGVGKVYLQTAIDCHSRCAWARLYPSKLPVTAVHLMNNDVIPTFEAHDAKIDTVLSDNGREFCGRPDQHPYELFLQLEEIEHRTTRVKRPQSNGIVERLHRTLLDEHFRVEGRRTWFETIEEMQAVLDDYLVGYNQRRPHQGRGMNGRTPAVAFVEGLLKPQQPKEEKHRKRRQPNKPPDAARSSRHCQPITLSVHSLWLGLMDIYNLFHSRELEADLGKYFLTRSKKDPNGLNIPEEHRARSIAFTFEAAHAGIIELRRLQVDLDVSVRDAYGWSDLDLQHDFYEIDTLPENDRVRHTISSAARKELLARLLKENHKRAAQQTQLATSNNHKSKQRSKTRAKSEQDAPLLDL